MPAKNALKIYSENSFYHIYNRGVEKRNIFTDQQDYAVFLSYLKDYLSPKDTDKLQQIISSEESSLKEKDKAIKRLSLKNFAQEIDLLCHALMPNHFHLLVKQKSANAIDHFMRSLGTRYSIYFNKKHRRVGGLYQGVYKAVLVTSDDQLLHLSRYIHRNPDKSGGLFSQPTTLPEYLSQRKTPWIKTEPILGYFNKSTQNNTYQNFMEIPVDFDISSLALDSNEDD